MIRLAQAHFSAAEQEHLFRYLDEQVFRFNEHKSSGDAYKGRKQGDSQRFVKTLRGVSGKCLTCRELIGLTCVDSCPGPKRGEPRAD